MSQIEMLINGLVIKLFANSANFIDCLAVKTIPIHLCNGILTKKLKRRRVVTPPPNKIPPKRQII
jgi:hypothetical protein